MDPALHEAIRQAPIIAVFAAGVYVALSGKFFVSRREYDKCAEDLAEYKSIVFDLTGVTQQLSRTAEVATHAVVNGRASARKRATARRR